MFDVVATKDLVDAAATLELSRPRPGAPGSQVECRAEASKPPRAVEGMSLVWQLTHVRIESRQQAGDPGNADTLGFPVLEERDRCLGEPASGRKPALTEDSFSAKLSEHRPERDQRFLGRPIQPSDPM
jgi:hypothetical protein